LTALEEALSRALADRASAPAPPVGDLAGRAIAAARAHRRLRLTGAAAVVICAIVAASVLTIRQPIRAPGVAGGSNLATPGEYVAAVASAQVPDVPVDYVHDQQLYLRNGRSLRLLATDVTRVQRVPEGFLVVEHRAYEKQRAWYVQERTGDQRIVLDGVRSVAVAQDGSGRLAWLDGTSMRYQETVFGQSTEKPTVREDTDRPLDGGPVAFAGPAVVLSDGGSGTPSKSDLWFPNLGDYVPTWADFFAIYGARSRATELVAARYTASRRVCLALVPAATLKLDESNCRYLDRRPAGGWVSPTGRWLVVADDRHAQMFDLSDDWRTGMAVSWAGVDWVGSDAAWLDQDTLAVHTSSGLVVLSPLANSKAVEYKLPVQSVIVGQ
jgi:hypothetical protein